MSLPRQSHGDAAPSSDAARCGSPSARPWPRRSAIRRSTVRSRRRTDDRGARRSSRGHQRRLHALEIHSLDAPPPNAFHDDANAGARHRFPRSGNASKQAIYQSPDGRDAVHAKVDADQLAQLVHREATGHPKARRPLALDVGLLDIVFVANLADDFLEHVLDLDQTPLADGLVAY